MDRIVYLGTDTLVTATCRAPDGSPIDNALITMSLADRYGTAVSGAQSLSLGFVSNGQYLGVLPASIDLAEGSEYSLTVIATAGPYTCRADVDCVAARKKGGC